jgi:hypothetical protein
LADTSTGISNQYATGIALIPQLIETVCKNDIFKTDDIEKK